MLNHLWVCMCWETGKEINIMYLCKSLYLQYGYLYGSVWNVRRLKTNFLRDNKDSINIIKIEFIFMTVWVVCAFICVVYASVYDAVGYLSLSSGWYVGISICCSHALHTYLQTVDLRSYWWVWMPRLHLKAHISWILTVHFVWGNGMRDVFVCLWMSARVTL